MQSNISNAESFRDMALTAADILDGIIKVTPETNPEAVAMARRIWLKDELTRRALGYKAAYVNMVDECMEEGL